MAAPVVYEGEGAHSAPAALAAEFTVMAMIRARNWFGNRSAPRRLAAAMIDALESRTLMSTSPLTATGSSSQVIPLMHSHLQVMQNAASSGTVRGYRPADIRKAYGFDQVTLPGGAAADGAGQTIAIVDAYNDPNIVADLAMFDQTFGISAPPSFSIVNQSGGTDLPRTDAGWAGEISLDVEWAHAIAPGANILLVEANSESVNDLITAVDYARHVAGVSTVSMSWGGSEFFSWGTGEFSSQTNLDPIFTTPSGHNGVTFVAAAGDQGAVYGVEWPASSANVVSVGGTSLNASAGNYVSEATWTGSTGGLSQVEPRPAYQDPVSRNANRATPDVAYDADPNTGFAVYDSLPDSSGSSGWEEVGGTSAGAPQWAALVAIANQGRALSGLGSLDGATETLPSLYSVYPTSDNADASTYFDTYNDVTISGQSGFFSQTRAYPARSGYDLATGLGTPQAKTVVAMLMGMDASGSGGTGGSGSGSGSSPTTTPAQLPSSPLAAAFASAPPADVLDNAAGAVKLRITNTVGTRFNGPVSVSLYASTDSVLSSEDTAITTVSLPRLNLRPGASKTIKLNFEYPTVTADGAYDLIASVSATAENTSPATAVSSPVNICPASVDLSTTFATGEVIVNPNQNSTASVTITNDGNVTATGVFGIDLYGSLDASLDAFDLNLGGISTRRIRLRPGESMTVRIRFVAPSNPGGTYDLIASTLSNTTIPDTNAANDLAAVGTI